MIKCYYCHIPHSSKDLRATIIADHITAMVCLPCLESRKSSVKPKGICQEKDEKIAQLKAKLKQKEIQHAGQIREITRLRNCFEDKCTVLKRNLDRVKELADANGAATRVRQLENDLQEKNEKLELLEDEKKTCIRNHIYFAKSHEYPCPICQNAKLEQEVEDSCSHKDWFISELQDQVKKYQQLADNNGAATRVRQLENDLHEANTIIKAQTKRIEELKAEEKVKIDEEEYNLIEKILACVYEQHGSFILRGSETSGGEIFVNLIESAKALYEKRCYTHPEYKNFF